jgi:hypothetical protein
MTPNAAHIPRGGLARSADCGGACCLWDRLELSSKVNAFEREIFYEFTASIDVAGRGLRSFRSYPVGVRLITNQRAIAR